MNTSEYRTHEEQDWAERVRLDEGQTVEKK